MYELYISKGIVPQTVQGVIGEKQTVNSENRTSRELSNEARERKIEKERIMAKHLGANNTPVLHKSSLMTAAQNTFGGYNFKPSMNQKQTHLASNFSELTGSTSFIENNELNKAKTIMEVRIL